MSKKLYVGGLSWNTTDDLLREAFAKFGEVTDAKVITDRYSGKSRGFGFVTFSDSQNAQEAIDQLDNTELDGRTIRVNEARERQGGGGGGGGRERQGGGGRGGGGRGGNMGGGGNRNNRW